MEEENKRNMGKQAWRAWAAEARDRLGEQERGKASSQKKRSEHLELAMECFDSPRREDWSGAMDGVGEADKVWLLGKLCHEFALSGRHGELVAAREMGGKSKPSTLVAMAGGERGAGPKEADGWKKCFELLMGDSGKSINDLRGGEALLHLALSSLNHRAIAAAVSMLEMGADPTLATKSGDTPWEMAARTGKSGLAIQMWNMGAGPGLGRSALCIAVEYGRAEVVGHLIEKGADATVVDRVYKRCALDMEDVGGGSVEKQKIYEYLAAARKTELARGIAPSGRAGFGEGRARL